MGFLLVFLIFPLASSTIIINNNFEEIYNQGDSINLNFSLERVQGVSDFVETFLYCENKDFLVNKEFVVLEGGKKQNFNIFFPVRNIEGDCEIKVSFFGEISYSPEFRVSDAIILSYELNDVSFFPGESIFLQGSAKKENGEKLGGFAKISLGDVEEQFFEISQGKFSFNFSLAQNFPAGKEVLNIFVYDVDFEEEIINSGSSNEEINIEKVVRELKVYSEDSISPPSILNFSVVSLDQSGEIFTGKNISIKIFDPLNNLVFSKDILSGEESSFEFFSDSLKGGWKINAYYGNSFTTFPFFVSGKEEILVSLNEVDGNLIFENVGNIPYEGVYGYSIFNGTNESYYFSFNLTLKPGQIHEERIPFSGEVNISIPGKVYQKVNLPFYSPTGYAISVGEEIDISNYYLFILGLVVIFLLYFFIFKKKAFSRLKLFFRKKTQSEKDKYIQEIPQINDGKRRHYLLFLESRGNISSYESIVLNSSLKLKKVNDSLAYVHLIGEGNEKRLYDLSKKIKEYSVSKEDSLTISLSVGYFGKENDLLKRFALFSRNLLKYGFGKIILTDKFFIRLGLNLKHQKKQIKVFERNLQIYVLD